MPEKLVTKRRPIWKDNRAVTAPLGVILLMGITLTAALTAGTALNEYLNAKTEHANAEANHSHAQADRARFYAECARAEIDDNLTPDPACPGYEEWEREGWKCTETTDSVYCEREEPKDDDIQVT